MTGLTYQVWGRGPVALDMVREWDEPEKDLRAVVAFDVRLVRGCPRKFYPPPGGVDGNHFSRREMRLLEGLAHPGEAFHRPPDVKG